MKPTVLVATTLRWFSTARLSMALTDAGCTVKAICVPDHPLHKTSVVTETFPYRGLAPIESFAEGIARAKPDFIIPGDDLAVQHLHALYNRERSKGSAGAEICALIEKSLGDAESFPIVYSRSDFMHLAEEEGIRTPKTKMIANIRELREWGAEMGFPAVIKANGTWGGEGVRVVRSQREAERAFRKLSKPPIVARVAKRVLLDRDATLVWPFLTRRRNVVNAQAFVGGREATSLVVCSKGTVLAALHFEVLCKQSSNAPASVVRLIDDPDMTSAAEKMVRRMNLSGFVGFDFMLEAETGNAYLIEINSRPTQVGHLRLGPGRDLPAAMHAVMSGGIVSETTKVTENDTIAFFPQEWLRNPISPFLQSGYHDVPWEEPALLRVCLRKQRKWGSLFSKNEQSQAFLEARLPRS
ncbi:MAG: ATP-grasp domain-containing protein [Candidatus Acidiferrales bacterium]